MLGDYFERFTKLRRIQETDLFGDVRWQYEDCGFFNAGIYTNSSIETRIADKNALKTGYTIVSFPDVVLKQGDYVRREKDGRIYRITSDCSDMMIPLVAEVHYWTVSA